MVNIFVTNFSLCGSCVASHSCTLCSMMIRTLKCATQVKPDCCCASGPKTYGHIRYSILTYSVLKLFTGFINAAFIAWKLMVANAINNAIAVVMANTCQPILVQYTKFCSHLFITNQAIGDAITTAMPTSTKTLLKAV